MAGKKGGQGITQWPETERPRELLLTQGPQMLTNAQLLALIGFFKLLAHATPYI